MQQGGLARDWGLRACWLAVVAFEFGGVLGGGWVVVIEGSGSPNGTVVAAGGAPARRLHPGFFSPTISFGLFQAVPIGPDLNFLSSTSIWLKNITIFMVLFYLPFP